MGGEGVSASGQLLNYTANVSMNTKNRLIPTSSINIDWGFFLFLFVLIYLKTEMNKPTNVNEYIANVPKEVQLLLEQIRKTILENATEAEESISYGMPAYKLYKKPLVYFAAYENHIGFYATPSGHEAFSAELSQYKQGKGSVQFPINEVLPLDLIKKIVIFRAAENKRKYSK